MTAYVMRVMKANGVAVQRNDQQLATQDLRRGNVRNYTPRACVRFTRTISR